MRRKSERSTLKKSKASPEKKIEKLKRGKTRRNKHSASENESGDETSPVREAEAVPVVKAVDVQPTKENSPEEAQDQVWQVKAAEGSGDVGEIKKLKICLTRPPSTPERVDRSPRSKRKLSRATSSSDSLSVEGVEDKKKSKHRTKKMPRESKDDLEKSQDSHGDEQEADIDPNVEPETSITESKKDDSNKVNTDETSISTTNDTKTADTSSADTSTENVKNEDSDKPSDADTTVHSPKAETTTVSNTESVNPIDPENIQEQLVIIESQPESSPTKTENSPRPRSMSVDKSEVLEIHADDSKCESSDNEMSKSKEYDVKEELPGSPEQVQEAKVSRTENVNVVKEVADNNDNIKATNESAVVENSECNKVETRKASLESDKDFKKVVKEPECDQQSKNLDRQDSTQSNAEEVHNGQVPPIHINRKRRWGSRPLKTQKSITISTDVLKDIIPDVKPVEFEEVIEEKKHKRMEVVEKVELPILPKIIIDNTDNVEQHRKEQVKEEKDRDMVKPKEPHIVSNRKISIINDSDSIIARPPSPPRHKQSCILYITNLVRPFTLQQLKNLLQRTGRIMENGFWIDRIKSKCYVKYEKEDQAIETRHALHGVTWPISNPKTLQVDFSTEEAFEKAKLNEDDENTQTSKVPGTVEDWLREQDLKRERGEFEKPWERKAAMREWDLGKNEKDKEIKEKLRHDERPIDKRRNRTPERSPEPARKFKKKEEEAPAKLLDDLFKKTKTTPCIYWLPLSAETIAVKEEQRRRHMAEYERRMHEQRRPHRRH